MCSHHIVTVYESCPPAAGAENPGGWWRGGPARVSLAFPSHTEHRDRELPVWPRGNPQWRASLHESVSCLMYILICSRWDCSGSWSDPWDLMYSVVAAKRITDLGNLMVWVINHKVLNSVFSNVMLQILDSWARHWCITWRRNALQDHTWCRHAAH